MFDIDSPFTMVVAIVAIGVLGGTISQYLKLQRERERRGPDNSAEYDSLRREVADLRERVKTLERITTDSERDLAREINRL